MAFKRGRCKNYGGCHYADDRKELEVDELNFICPNPDCGAPLFPLIENGGRTRREISGVLRVVIASGMLIVLAAGGYFLFGERAAPPATGKSLAEWMANAPTEPEIQGILANLKSRAAQIDSLKQVGKVIGSEYGLLNPASGVILSADEKDLLNQENEDRRSLFTFIAGHSNPPVTYERVANEYAMKQWKEWPAR